MQIIEDCVTDLSTGMVNRSAAAVAVLTAVKETQKEVTRVLNLMLYYLNNEVSRETLVDELERVAAEFKETDKLLNGGARSEKATPG